MKLQTLRDLYIHELQYLHCGESQFRAALPRIIGASSDEDLKAALRNQLNVTNGQIMRLNNILKRHGAKPETGKCRGMTGLLGGCENMIEMLATGSVRDLGIISTCQQVEHNKIAGYVTARSYAETLGTAEEPALLAESLEEESAADDELTSIAILLQSQYYEEPEETPYDDWTRSAKGRGKALTH